MYIIQHSGMSNLEASLGDSLMPSMHSMELAFCRLRSSSSLSFSKASSASSSLTSIVVVGWEVPSPEGSGYKEVSPSLSMSCPPQKFKASMREMAREQDSARKGKCNNPELNPS
jgi:hypothetical protein